MSAGLGTVSSRTPDWQMTNAYGILFIHFWDSTYSCQDDDQSHVTQDILRIDAHFTADISHLSITLMKCCGHDTWRCLCKWQWDWSGWHGSGPPITIYWFLLLNRLNGRQLSKQIAENGLWYNLSQIITRVSLSVRRSGDVVGYACLRLAHRAQKERRLYTDN